jgi:methanethiol S-methyltransferase
MSVLIITISTLLWAAVHSLLAALGAKTRARQLFGPTAERWYRLTYNIFAGISFLPILALMVVLPDQRLYAIPSPWLLLTALGQFGGVIIIVLGVWQADAWSFLGLRQILSPPEQGIEPVLIVNGLYRWMRHPLYTGGLIVLWLMPVMSLNSLALTIMLSLYLVIGAIIEERRLLHEFGQAYAEYQRNVPLLIPKSPSNK